MGTLLIPMYMNDLPDCIPNSTFVHLYVDDVRLYVT